LEEAVCLVNLVFSDEQINIPGMAQGQVAIDLQGQHASLKWQDGYIVFLKKPAKTHQLCGIG